MLKYFLKNVSLALLVIFAILVGSTGIGIFGAYITSLIGLSIVGGYILTLVMLLVVIICILAGIDTYQRRDEFK